MTRIMIPVDKIGAVIGPGGKTIRAIIEATGATIDVDNDGSVTIGATDGEAAAEAIRQVEALTKEIEVGQRYTGKVTRIMGFGAFVELVPGKDGLVHISELDTQRVESVEAVVKIGDELEVMVTEIDRMGRVNVSRRAILEDWSAADLAEHGGRSADRPPRRDNDRGPRRDSGGSGGRGTQYDRSGGR